MTGGNTSERGHSSERDRGPDSDHDRGRSADHDRASTGHDRASRTIVRRATLYSVAFLAAGLAIAMAGAALVAWMLGRAGLPFMRTWLILSVIIVLPGLLATVWKLIRGR